MWQFLPMALKALAINTGVNAVTGKPLLQNSAQAALLSQFGGANSLLGNQIPGAEVVTAPVTNTIIPGSIESELGMAGADGVFRNQDYFANVFGNPIYTGGEGLLTNIGDELKTSLSSIAPQNLLGVASLLNDQPDTSAYRQSAGTGGVSRGSGQGLAVQMPQARVFKRRKA